MPMGRLAERLDVSLPNVTGIVERMVEHDLVERGSDADDRRIVSVSSRPTVAETVEEIDLIRRGQMAAVIGRLTADQQERALRTFTELRAGRRGDRSRQVISHPIHDPQAPGDRLTDGSHAARG